jgi:hypothetical protein
VAAGTGDGCNPQVGLTAADHSKRDSCGLWHSSATLRLDEPGAVERADVIGALVSEHAQMLSSRRWIGRELLKRATSLFPALGPHLEPFAVGFASDRLISLHSIAV